MVNLMLINCTLFFQSLNVGAKYKNTGEGKQYSHEDKKKRPLWPGRQGFIVPSKRKQSIIKGTVTNPH